MVYRKIPAGFETREEVKTYLEDGGTLYFNGSSNWVMYYDDSRPLISAYRCRNEEGYESAIAGIWDYLDRFEKEVVWYKAIPEEGVYVLLRWNLNESGNYSPDEVSEEVVMKIYSYDPVSSFVGIKPVSHAEGVEIDTASCRLLTLDDARELVNGEFYSE